MRRIQNVMTENQIYKRYNEAIADLADYTSATIRGDEKRNEKSLRSAGEGLSEALEGAMKNHMHRHMKTLQLSNALNRFELPKVVEEYYWCEDEGCEMDLWSQTVNDEETTVDFAFIKNNRDKLANDAKHKGGITDYEVVKQYMFEIAKFIKEYIDPEAPLKTIADYSQPEMDKQLRLYLSCDKFTTSDRTYILLIDNPKVNKSYLSQLSRVKWSLVISLDKNAENSDFMQGSYCERGLDYRPIKLRDRVSKDEFSPYTETPNIIFANGYHSTEPTYPTYKEWNRNNCSGKLNSIVASLSSVYATQKTIAVSLLEEKDWNQGLYDILDRNFVNVSFVIANDEQGKMKELETFNSDEIIDTETSIQQLDQCLTTYLDSTTIERNTDEYRIPCRAGGDGILTAIELARLEENFEVLYDGIDSGNDELREDYLRGHSILTWEGVRRQFAAKSNNFVKRYIKHVDSVIKNSRGQLMIVHEPGYGGTTVARQLGHHYFKDLDVLFLKSYKEDLLSQLDALQQKTKTIIMVFMEIPQAISYEEFILLYQRTNDTRPYIFIGIQRGDANQDPSSINKNSQITVFDWHDDVSVLLDTFKPYLDQYPEIIKKKKEAVFNKILMQNDMPPYMRTPFYLGLLTFEEKFEAIDSYIHNFAQAIKGNEQKRKTLIYLAICDKYAHSSLHEAFFVSVFMAPSGTVFKLEDYFHPSDGIINSLLTKERQGNTTFWKIRHPLFSNQLLKSLLYKEGLPVDKGWKFNLGVYCQKLIEDSGKCIGYSDQLTNILKDLFIGSSMLRDGEKFTELVNDLPKEEKKLVFQELHETFPENAHFCSHLGRYYAREEGNKKEALKYVNQAIVMSSEDPLLHHIKGSCLQSIIYDMMTKIQDDRQRTGAYEDADYKQVMSMFEEASKAFETTRNLYNSKKREDLHGYISHIKLLIRMFDFMVNLNGLKKQEVVAGVKDPYFSWLEEAQNLLEDAHRQHLGSEDPYVQDCDVNLWNQYENPSKIIESLNNQLNTTKYPALVRRQIVRLYLHNEDKYKTEQRINRRILELMEDNISAEPANEKNFYLWFKAARYSLLRDDQLLANLSKWRSLNPTTNITFYNYVFNVIKALEGSTEAAATATDLFYEMRRIGGFTSTHIREWYSRGPHHLTAYSDISPEEYSEWLVEIEGRVDSYDHEGSAYILLDCGLKVFFKPVTSKLDGNCLNRKVKFYLGFAYDGLRAADSSVFEL